jgi:hypothetical protein
LFYLQYLTKWISNESPKAHTKIIWIVVSKLKLWVLIYWENSNLYLKCCLFVWLVLPRFGRTNQQSNGIKINNRYDATTIQRRKEINNLIMKQCRNNLNQIKFKYFIQPFSSAWRGSEEFAWSSRLKSQWTRVDITRSRELETTEFKFLCCFQKFILNIAISIQC